MRIIYFISAIIFIFGLSACERDVNISFPKDQSKLVIHSFISPDQDSIRVYVSRSNPFVNQTVGKTDPVNTATVFVNDVQLEKGNRNGLYYAPSEKIQVKSGQTYTLKASAEGYASVTASTTVPKETPTKLEISSFRNEPQGGKEFDITIFDEHPNTYQYYAIYGFSEYTRVLLNGEKRTSRFQIYFPEPLLEDGNLINGQLTFKNLTQSIYQPDLFKDKKILVKFLNTDEGYFRYHKTIKQSDSESPLGEPIINYSNVENGLGIFASYTTLSKTFPIP